MARKEKSKRSSTADFSVWLTPEPKEFQNEAVDFISESLSNFASEKWKFSILHAAMGLELLLKERLAILSPLLIFSDVDEPGLHTVSLRKGLKRLRNAGISFSQDEIALIEVVVGWRDSVAHRRSKIGEADARERLGAIYRLIAQFCSNELGQEIRDLLPRPQYLEYQNLLRRSQAALKDAQGMALISDIRQVGVENCPECWGSGTVALEDGEARCYLCKQRFGFERCAHCFVVIFGNAPRTETSDGNLCIACGSWLASHY